MLSNGVLSSLRLLLAFLAVVGPAALLLSHFTTFGGYGALNSPSRATQQAPLQPDHDSQLKGVTLRHVFHHGAGKPGPRARRLDITPERAIQAAAEGAEGALGPFPVRTTAIFIDRPAVQQTGQQIPISPLMISEDVPGPDVTDKETTIQLASMCEDAYHPGPGDAEWMDIDDKYNNSIPFGWEDSGIRGHVFSDDANSTVILSVKGTTVAMFEGNGTSGHDKENDNLFGSCCCGQGGSFLWRTVCDCKTGTYACDQTCVKEEFRKPNRYYEATLELFDEVTKLYPNSNIIATGHSLGGVLASFIGLHQGIPSVSFEAYPQALAASRLGLPTAGQLSPLRKNTGGFHFGHTGDPVYMGTCGGTSSFCSIAGYAFETVCHTGKRCVYDVVKDWGWRQSTKYHSLRYAIDNIYKQYEKAAPCIEEDVDCVDCYLWKFEDGTHPKPSTTSTVISTTSTRTRTETCKTPGWWGCKDETTTAGPTSTTAATTTSTCETPGWFGCKDKITTTDVGTTPTATQTTSTCTSKGWFGRCLDDAPKTTPAAEAHAHWRTAPTAIQTSF